MASININVDVVGRLHGELIEEEEKLSNVIFPDISNTLEEMVKNVKGTEVNDMLRKLFVKTETIFTDLSKHINNVNSFLEDQVNSYKQIENQTEHDLNEVFAEMKRISEQVLGKDINQNDNNPFETRSSTNGSILNNYGTARDIIGAYKAERKASV